MAACPLCLSPKSSLLHEHTDKNLGARPFYQCGECALVFLPEEFHLSPEEEKKRYDYHQNDPADEGYRNFLNQLIEPLSEHLSKGMRGLDYGCGPGPAINVLLKDKNVHMDNYDPIYRKNKELLKREYDVITSTEVAEHFARPREEFQKLKALLKPEGLLGIMTQTLEPGKDFKDWWYYTEPTHVSFYSPQTFDWIAKWLNLSKIFAGPNVVIFRKKKIDG